jgi:hypothetical protein
MDIMEKPDMNRFFDRCMKQALRSKADEIVPPSLLLNRISAEIRNKEMENISMNNIFKLKRVKPLIIAALVLILSAATCFAASQISSLVSTSTDAFDKFPTAQQVDKAVNYVPDYPETFFNGFRFESASINNTQALDNDKNKMSEIKGITFFYTRDNAQKGQLLTLSTDPENPGLTGDLGLNEEIIADGNINLIYSQVTFKVVPEGYVPTVEENQKMEQGVLWISYGADEIETSNVQYVKWVKDGIVYNLMDKGYGLEKSEILGMTKVVIGDAE